MKRSICALLMIWTLCASCLSASAESGTYDCIWETFGASSNEEMQDAIQAWWDMKNPEDKVNVRCRIRYGGTTKELLSDNSWDLAIVSSKDVDLRQLVNKKDMIEKYPLSLTSHMALHQYLVSENLRELLPKSKKWFYRVSFYDYDPQNDEAILLVVNGTSKGMVEYTFTDFIMEKRPADKVREMEGVRIVQYWTLEELLAAPGDWDAACVTVERPEMLQSLSDAGLLYDLSQESYFLERSPSQESQRRERTLGVYGVDGRMLGVPYNVPYEHEPESYDVILVNAQSEYLSAAIDYAKKFVRGWDVFYLRNCYPTLEDVYETWGIWMNE